MYGEFNEEPCNKPGKFQLSNSTVFIVLVFDGNQGSTYVPS